MNNDPVAAAAQASTLFAHTLLSALVKKGILSQEDAAQVLIDTAEKLRMGTEDGGAAQSGEATAQVYETMAGWLLGHPSLKEDP